MSDSDSTPIPSTNTKSKHPFAFLLLLLSPILLGVFIYQLDSFHPAPYPPHELTESQPMKIPKRNSKMLEGAEKIGYEELSGPEDLAYDLKSGVIYTGCVDGWVKRVRVNELAAVVGGGGGAVVEDWVNTGGRPLGLVNGQHGEVIIADGYKGLLNATAEGEIHVLTEEADGLRFKLTNAVDIAKDGILYFTESSYKYAINEGIWEFLEGAPHGRLLSYDPSSKQTKVLLENLYFANGVAVSADNHFIIFCESPLRRCKRYYLSGEKQGSVDIFVENLPGLPDNIMYDGEGLFWIALYNEHTTAWKLAQRYPFIRKLIAIMEKYIGRSSSMEKNGGVIAVDLDGNPIAHYHDQNALITSGIIIGDHLYCGSVATSHILRLDLNQNPAVSTH